MKSNGTLKRYSDYTSDSYYVETEDDEDIINYVNSLLTNNGVYMCIPGAGHKDDKGTPHDSCIRTWMNTRSTDGDGSHANYLGVWDNGINLPSKAYTRYNGMPIRPCITIKW